jgi:Fe-S-cluster-containing dehydrogenase component
MKQEQYGLLIDYFYCTGCHTCEVVCKLDHKLSDEQYGVKIAEIGPWEMDDGKWQLYNIPVPTEHCDLCGERTAKGKQPSCVHNCQAACMEFGTISDLQETMKGRPRMALFIPNQ